ncbi:MAG: hypothetical protein IJZ51_01410 [Ruminiclostridium sp.]|nr:hypothetical protein [Ruminiclostridium sp.]
MIKSCIPNIYDVWKKQNWEEPVLFETFEPERINLVLPINNLGEEVTINSKKNLEQKYDSSICTRAWVSKKQ